MRFRGSLMVGCGLLLANSVFAVPATKPGPVQLELTHRLDEERAERLEPLIDEFNKKQNDVHVTLVRRGDSFDPKQLNLVTRDEHAKLLDTKAKFKPLSEVMRQAKEPLDASKLSPELKEGLSDAKGQLIALPVAFSTPVLYINKDLFRKAGLDPETPPRTWAEAQVVAGKLSDAGSRCPFTTSWPVEVFIDNVSALDGAPIGDAKGRLAFNGLPQVKHIAMMATWYKASYFSYSGRRDEADRRFASGECAMLTSSSALYPALSDKKLNIGVSPLPYHDDVYGAPQRTLADGASLWVGEGLKPAEVKAVAKFINYVMAPDIQVGLTAAGGFLPMTPAARSAATSKLLAENAAGLKVALAQLQGKGAVPTIRVAQNEKLRLIAEEELEAVWANRKPAKEALDEAVARGNQVLDTASAKVSTTAKPKAKRGKS